MIQYDAAVIRGFAQSLYSEAEAVVLRYTVAALVVGAGIGFVVGTVASFGAGGALLGAAIGAVVGYFGAQAKAASLRLAAQVALCQVQIEENTRGATAREASGPKVVEAPLSPQAAVPKASPPPVVNRPCPHCGGPIHPEATRCLHCMKQVQKAS